MYQSGEVKAKLDRVIEYLMHTTASDYNKGARKPMNFAAWFHNVQDAVDILADAKKEVIRTAFTRSEKTCPPRYKTPGGFDFLYPTSGPTRLGEEPPAAKRLKKATTVYETPFGPVTVVDMGRLEYEMVKDGIGDALIQSLLPFQTSLVEGETHIHIQNESLYTVETKYHNIRQGETLCAKAGETFRVGRGVKKPTCPGCIAKGKGIAAYNLTK